MAGPLIARLILTLLTASIFACGGGGSGSPSTTPEVIPNKLDFEVPEKAKQEKLSDEELMKFRTYAGSEQTGYLDLEEVALQIWNSDDKQESADWLKQNPETKALLQTVTQEETDKKCELVRNHRTLKEFDAMVVGARSSETVFSSSKGKDCSLVGTFRQSTTSEITGVNSVDRVVNINASMELIGDYTYQGLARNDDTSSYGFFKKISAKGVGRISPNGSTVVMRGNIVGKSTNRRSSNLILKCSFEILLKSADTNLDQKAGEKILHCSLIVPAQRQEVYLSVHKVGKMPGEYWLNDRAFNEAEWLASFPNLDFGL